MRDLPVFDDTGEEGSRFLWRFPIRVDIWVPNIDDGPSTTPLVKPASMGRIQVGGEFAVLSPDEFGTINEALLSCPTVRQREP
jgi:hypothetical protein